jgi:hypothetical protein
MPLDLKFWEGVGVAMIRSQKNCLFENHRFTCERWGGDLSILNLGEFLKISR